MGRTIGLSGHPRDQNRTAERLSRVGVYTDEAGSVWYRYLDVCYALGLNQAVYSKYILPENKVCVRADVFRYIRKRELYLNRAGVATLVLLTPGLPLRATLEALQEA